jgi:hypothetical protein
MKRSICVLAALVSLTACNPLVAAPVPCETDLECETLNPGIAEEERALEAACGSLSEDGSEYDACVARYHAGGAQ